MKTVLVIPTNRPAMLREFMEAWEPERDWHHTIVVFDGPEAPPEVRSAEWTTYDWRDVDRMNTCAGIFSRRNAGIRIFGYLLAAQAGMDVIATIDDDCRPLEGHGLMSHHIEALTATPRWISSADNIQARGMPYRQLGTMRNVMVNLGLWQGVGDYDAPRSLVERADLKHYEPPRRHWLAPQGQYLPISTMSLAFRREALPLMYLPLMGQGQPYDRFDDIWGGIIAKKVCDHLGWSISVGPPIVSHARASNPFRNLVAEAAGIARNESFWLEVDAVILKSSSANGAMHELACMFRGSNDPHTRKLGEAIPTWVALASQNNT